MGSRFNIKYGNLSRSVNGIKNTLQKKELSLNDKKSLLYDFGGCLEQTWKLFKYYLEYVEGYDSFGNASKNVYREVYRVGVITEKQCILLLETIDLRKILFHEYNYEDIDRSCEKIALYFELFDEMLLVFNDIYIRYKHEFEDDLVNY